MHACPLIVDLDGTLIRTDMLHETILQLIRDKPWHLFRLPCWLTQGLAALKQKVAAHTHCNPEALPYNQDVIAWLTQQRAEGRTLILCSGSDHKPVQTIATHLNLFEDVMASDGAFNMTGPLKAQALNARFGPEQYDYVGNSSADLAVWKHARRAIIIHPKKSLLQRTKKICEVEKVFQRPALHLKVWGRVLRVHQWLKNLLLFVPLFASHQFTDPTTWLPSLIAFLSFSLCASAVYVTNDLLDLESDRLHASKKRRPFASGALPTWVGLLLVPLLLTGSLLLATQIPTAFFICLFIYFLLTCAYSWRLKRLLLIDCLTLALLYTLRIIAGTAAVQMALSFWLLACSVFLFLSLAFIKRYAELIAHTPKQNDQNLHGRAYKRSDAPLIQSFGVTAGYAAAVVLALYLNSHIIVTLYRTPEWIWGAIPVLLFWISWMWMQAARGYMHEDPLVFAMKDRVSLLTGLLFASVFLLGTFC